MKKHKIVIDRRVEVREGAGKRYEVDDTPLDDLNALDEDMSDAGWSDDPGTGRAVLLADGREVLNPMPVAPPLSIAQSTEPSVNELVERALARHYAALRTDDEVDTVEDMDDFGDDTEWSPMSLYEVVLTDEVPAVPAAPPVAPAVVDDLAKVEAEAQAVLAKGKGKKPPPEPGGDSE